MLKRRRLKEPKSGTNDHHCIAKYSEVKLEACSQHQCGIKHSEQNLHNEHTAAVPMVRINTHMNIHGEKKRGLTVHTGHLNKAPVKAKKGAGCKKTTSDRKDHICIGKDCKSSVKISEHSHPKPTLTCVCYYPPVLHSVQN